jgi:hypothetical protein
LETAPSSAGPRTSHSCTRPCTGVTDPRCRCRREPMRACQAGSHARRAQARTLGRTRMTDGQKCLRTFFFPIHGGNPLDSAVSVVPQYGNWQIFSVFGTTVSRSTRRLHDPQAQQDTRRVGLDIDRRMLALPVPTGLVFSYIVDSRRAPHMPTALVPSSVRRESWKLPSLACERSHRRHARRCPWSESNAGDSPRGGRARTRRHGAQHDLLCAHQ